MDKKNLIREAVILGALLHDIGKISQRIGGEYYLKHAEFGSNFISALSDIFGEELIKRLTKLVEKHHNPTNREEYILSIADKLSAAERLREHRPRLKSNETALVALTSRLEFKESKGKEKYYPLCSLKVSKECLFPKDEEKVQDGEYENLWDNFVKKVKRIGKYQ
ncbi:MAG: HD domain-containing protein, partial [Candidatus Omnitrophota bacterium]